MIRRFSIMNAGLLALLMPACMGTPGSIPTDPYYAVVSQPTVGERLAKARGLSVIPTANQYGQAKQPVRSNPAASTDPTRSREVVQKDAKPSADTVKRTEQRGNPEPTPRDDKTTLFPKDLLLPAEETPNNSKITQSPTVMAQPSNVIAPPWPNLGGTDRESNSIVRPVENTPTTPSDPSTLLPVGGTQERSLPPLPQAPASLAPVSSPSAQTPLPQLDIPSSPMPEAVRTSHASPSQPTTHPMATHGSVATPVTADSPVVRVLKAFQENRPAEAAAHLKQLDPANQEILLSMMPLIARLEEGHLHSVPPEEIAAMVEKLQAATALLQSHAALRAERVCFCRAVRKFGDVDAYDPYHEFRPGDMVHLYLELKNFAWEPVSMVSRSTSTAIADRSQPIQRGYAIRMTTRLEVTDATGKVLARYDLPKNDIVHSTPHDYYHTYRFCVPEHFPAGTYTVWITITDRNKPGSPAVRHSIPLRVGRNG